MGKNRQMGGGKFRPVKWLSALALSALLLVTHGCSDPVTIYQVPGTCVSSGQKVLVMPFMDTRTFVDNGDPYKETLGAHARDIYVAAMRDNPGAAGAVVLTPDMPTPEKSLTNAEVAEIGRRHGADIVVAGQIFSFTDTRAASIPPRAGMFVRVVSAEDGALLFVGDHYQSAGVPGAPGGRDLQAKNVANTLVEGLVRQAGPALQVAGTVASASALAMIAPVSAKRFTANKGGSAPRSGNNVPTPKIPPFLGISGGGNVDPNQWDDQIAPAVPPVLDFNDEYYHAPAKAANETPLPPPAPRPENTAAGEELRVEVAQTAQPADLGVPMPPPVPEPMNTAHGEEPRAETAQAALPAAPDMPLPPPALQPEEPTPEEELRVEVTQAALPAAPDMPLPPPALQPEEPTPEEELRVEVAQTAMPEDMDIPLPPPPPAELVAEAMEASGPVEDFADAMAPPLSEPEASEAIVADADLSEPDELLAAGVDEERDAAFEDGPARIADSLERDDAAVSAAPAASDEVRSEPEIVSEAVAIVRDDAAERFDPAEDGEYMDASFAARMTGDELAADLFASGGEVWEVGMAVAPSYEVSSPYAAPEAAPVAPMTEHAGALVSAAPDGEAFDYVTEAELSDWLGDADGETHYSEAPFATDDNGPIFSTPLAVEQPRPVKAVTDPAASRSPALLTDSGTPAVVSSPAPAFASAGTGRIRVLILPYHDRENPNNLIERTGGGEVVTTLYGTQLAQDPELLLLWDGSGQATHDRLLGRDEAVMMGKMVGADYVMRGQVVEFRRAQSVPSFYSAVISTAVLAAQIFFAEFSGVDVATEVYRVADGRCVMSRRDRAQQKYVVQAEKTVRKLAAGMAKSVGGAVKAENPEEMDPLIDELSPVTIMTNPR